ncbi:hypoxanthine phosphoribosyltransferase [Rhodoblastus acidophilus]|uniref:Hypoxanthine phosphoribosyltransferase n=1 Tax=Rhodoblastus acidophilus TaxID=1074 RepID=A0A212R2Y4_RHOAC|nr:hypoxanthine phosphoribosyltransferase [Rhodoblastus acidophilus]PPQ40306.1 hypoxanthine phosphoribosyltransferase [Rhodoblastus acidophilus]RAI17403.1 hypoxanthine phosphoribosyltransferase [Rhodoblastus acidophilus]SNB66231.1 hypoxanthine phosphoribosyltransferase [Rhodoblastus acidophilus]
MSLDILFSEAEIAARVEAMGYEIAEAVPQRLLAVPIMTGAFIFAADLLRALYRAGVEPEVDFLQVGSYGNGTTSSGTVQLLREIQADVTGRDVLLIDDILESGRTLTYARNVLIDRGARRVLIAVALEKPNKLAVEIAADYVGFQCPDRFVLGYGMDYAGKYRELPFIGALDQI